MPPASDDARIVAMTFDEDDNAQASPEILHERKVALFDILQKNYFAPEDAGTGPYRVRLRKEAARLIFEITSETDAAHARVSLALGALSRTIKAYFTLCESYYEAIRTAPLSRVEALDKSRRALHNDGARLLQDRLKGKIGTDTDTARRLFTLICVIRLKG